MLKSLTVTAGAVVVLGLTVAPSAQSLGELAKKTAAERERLAKEAAAKNGESKDGKTEPPKKVYTNRDLGSGSAYKPPEPVNIGNDPKTLEALNALKAVRSALGGGANAEEYKRYYLDAKVKIDALPATRPNQALRDVSDIYGDATTLTVGRVARSLSRANVADLKLKYAADYELMHYLENLSAGISPSGSATVTSFLTSQAGAAASVLMARAADRLQLLTTGEQESKK